MVDTRYTLKLDTAAWQSSADNRVIAGRGFEPVPEYSLEMMQHHIIAARLCARPAAHIRCEADFLPHTFVRVAFWNIMVNLGRPSQPVRSWIQQHPSKCPCPLASGVIPPWQSICAVLLQLSAALLLQTPSPCSAAERSTDSTWSQGLTSGVNGPIPVIVVDQFGYPTQAVKTAVIRNPQVGYESAVHFTPGANQV
jgi:hypothetical protein